MRLTHTCIIAVAAVLVAPAYAQQSTPSTTTSPGATAATTASSQAMSADQIKSSLEKADIKDRKELKGRLVRAESPEGHTVLLVIGPSKMEGDKSLSGYSQDKIRGQLTTAGFKSIQFVDDPKMVRGKLSDDKTIIALAGDPGWRGSPGAAQNEKPNRDRLTEQLGKAGLSDRNEFKGKLMRASTAEGRTLFVIVGPEGFEGDKSVEFSATDLTKFQQSGFRSAAVVPDVTIVRGKLDDMAVIALAGRAITEAGS